MSHVDEEVNNFLSEIRREEEEMDKHRKMKSAKSMADSVRASTVVSIQPMGYQEASGSQGKKKDKKNKKLVRMAGGQIWEDPSLAEWEDGMFLSVKCNLELEAMFFIIMFMFQMTLGYFAATWEMM